MLSVKVASAHDVEFIASVQTLQHVEQFIRPEEPEIITDSLRNPNDQYLIAMANAKGPVGFAYLRGMQNPNHCVELCKLAISDPGCGYGKQFLPMVLSLLFNDYAKHRVWLDVFPHNKNAQHLYKQQGFVEEGILREAYHWDGRFQSAILMSLLAPEYKASMIRPA